MTRSSVFRPILLLALGALLSLMVRPAPAEEEVSALQWARTYGEVRQGAAAALTGADAASQDAVIQKSSPEGDLLWEDSYSGPGGCDRVGPGDRAGAGEREPVSLHLGLISRGAL